MKWSKGELELLWSTVNPGNGNPSLMAAIALAESAGDDQAENSIGACGLWQIHPYEAGCKNPYTNARQAGAKLRTQGLGAWETYTNGSYRQFLSGGSKAQEAQLGVPFNPFEPGKLLGEGLGEAGGSILNWPGQIIGTFKTFGELLTLLTSKEGWIRIGKVVLGLFLLLTGVLGMAKIEATQTVTKTASKATEVAALIPK